MSVHKFQVEIDQTWDDVVIKFLPNDKNPLRHSETLTCSFFKSTHPKTRGLVYVYRQENDEYGLTDDEMFFGAAQIEILEDGKTMTGYYWTRRQWQIGLNTAGKIQFNKI